MLMLDTNQNDFIDIAIEEAKLSLRGGNSGFGAVVVKNNILIAKAHDTNKSSKDPTAHAEINAIRKASKIVGDDFNDCVLVSTHEPCPMCSTAIVWAGIHKIAFGSSISDSIKQGRRRININCGELFKRAGASVEIIRDVKKDECSLLYNSDVRKSIKQLIDAAPSDLVKLSDDLREKRIKWFYGQNFQPDEKNILKVAYQLFLRKLGITADEAPIVKMEKSKIVIRSQNFCPTLEACKILDKDTREVCKQLSEEPTQALLQMLHPDLRFSRNYDAIRPYKPYCEEIIYFTKDK